MLLSASGAHLLLLLLLLLVSHCKAKVRADVSSCQLHVALATVGKLQQLKHCCK